MPHDPAPDAFGPTPPAPAPGPWPGPQVAVPGGQRRHQGLPGAAADRGVAAGAGPQGGGRGGCDGVCGRSVSSGGGRGRRRRGQQQRGAWHIKVAHACGPGWAPGLPAPNALHCCLCQRGQLGPTLAAATQREPCLCAKALAITPAGNVLASKRLRTWQAMPHHAAPHVLCARTPRRVAAGRARNFTRSDGERRCRRAGRPDP